ncbi:MAG: Ig-like domain-containing protein [Proteobacteria bacterium]|nr:Ig-like domain-containing protein [Pseudomonadota bacterium]
MDGEEVDNTEYVCDGADGANSLISISNEPAGTNCLCGGKRLEVGLDDGDGGSTSGDSILQSGEVDTISFICSDTLPVAPPPAIVSVSPSTGATGVDVESVISATFDQNMNDATMTISNFFVSDGTNNISGSIAYTNKTATFTHIADLKYNTQYTVLISTGVRNEDDVPLADNYSWSFTTKMDNDPPTVVS